MNAPLPPAGEAALPHRDNPPSLDDKYTLAHGRVYLSGTQALVRLLLLQQERDAAAGLNTAGFVSGYRGSPLGGLDMALWKAKPHLAQHRVVFQAGLNEDLAATSVWGTQQANLYPTAQVDGVFGMWYGKGPGVDRTADVFKHANAAGSSQHGGVLVLAGDDHAAKSSTLPHQSEHIFKACGIPVLYPANVQEYLDYGLHGWAMSRYSGLWVAMKCVTDVVESSASVEIDPQRVQIVTPTDFVMPPDGLNIRWPDPPLQQEARLLDHKWYAALAYVRANRLDRVVIDSPHARFGIMTAGKAYADVRQALVDLGLDEATCAQIGLRLYKVGCVWPLEAHGARAFAQGLQEILVVEEKRQILEYALKEELYNWRDDVRPKVFGKFDEKDNLGGEWSLPQSHWLLPAHYELNPASIARAIAARLTSFDLPDDVRRRMQTRLYVIDAKENALARPHVVTERKPWFCSGCPHNTSTRVPEGSRAMAGIGCHYMSIWMDRSTSTFSQMGGEGAAWIGQHHFVADKHIFANLGDGTYFHSGSLAVRAAIASGANITYKILYNDAVAMTGGQPVDGVLTVPQIAHAMLAEGAKKVVIVTDEPDKYNAAQGLLPADTEVFHRDALDTVQQHLRGIAGTTILIYDQTCATEKRRRRKRGTLVDPARRVWINPEVCEGCGDCSAKSNCLSVEPLETPLGTKRKINQSSCNKDFSCLNGFCPSFVTLEGAQLRKPEAKKVAETSLHHALPTDLPEPELPSLAAHPYGILVGGVGGTGVLTIGGWLGMAAHLEGKGVTVLDMSGLAQKGGAVMSHVQIGARPADLHATRIAMGEADLLIGCDSIVAASDEALAKAQFGVTRAVLNSAVSPTAAFIKNPQWRFPGTACELDVQSAVGDAFASVDASGLAVRFLGDAIFTNPLLLGYAWQQGWVPLAAASLLQAMALNGVAIEKNQQAFLLGRQLAHLAKADPAGFASLVDRKPSQNKGLHKAQQEDTLDTLLDDRMARLTAYQDATYAQRYAEVVEQVRRADEALGRTTLTEAALTASVIRQLYKLMAYKDEYEVARLYTAPAFLDSLRQQFAGEPGRDYQLQFHLAPPLFAQRNAQGELRKQHYGPWILNAMRLLAKLKSLRGTVWDIFGKTAERRMERALIVDYTAMVFGLLKDLTPENYAQAVEKANLPENVRGFGHIKDGEMRRVGERLRKSNS